MHLGCFMIYLTHFVTLREVSPSECLLVSFFVVTNTGQEQLKEERAYSGSKFERIQSAWQSAQDCRRSRQLIIRHPQSGSRGWMNTKWSWGYRTSEPALVICFLPQGSVSYKLKTFPKDCCQLRTKRSNTWACGNISHPNHTSEHYRRSSKHTFLPSLS